jgi:hypothetical protein
MLKGFGINNPQQQAWREKWALCVIAFIMMILTAFFLLFFSNLVCPATLTDNTIPVNVFGKYLVFIDFRYILFHSK